MMNTTLKFFSRYNSKMVFDYDELSEFVENNYLDISYLKKFLEYLEEYITPSQIYQYYIKEYFSEKYGYCEAFNIFEFLHYGVIDFECLQDDLYKVLREGGFYNDRIWNYY